MPVEDFAKILTCLMSKISLKSAKIIELDKLHHRHQKGVF